MNAPVITLRNVSLQVGSTTLLDDITLSVAAGERIGIIGPNGAGKSSLLRALGGVAPGCLSGTIEVLGRNLARPLSRRDKRGFQAEVGQVFQALQLVPRLSALDNVLIGALARHRSPLSWARLFPEATREQAQHALQTVGMEALGSVRTDRLSGGQRQKVAVARLLMQQPGLILADEPTAALDPAAAAEIAVHLAGCAHDTNVAMLVVVHEPALLPLLAERVIGLRHGRILFDLAALYDVPSQSRRLA